ncbi:hypothetical protein AABM38_10330 [Heyndrickxia sp. MSNUG]|uniref:hypothetical protein n=1 Tax=Heyndrickxia sp. MSNUG TaxID=3136677 RepID=UPI003C2D6808
MFREFIPAVFADVHDHGFNTITEDDHRFVPIQVAAVVADPFPDPFSGKQYKVIKMF